MWVWAVAPWQDLVLLTKSAGQLDQAPLLQLLKDFSQEDLDLGEFTPEETAGKWHVFFCSATYHETGLMGGGLSSRWKSRKDLGKTRNEYV